MNFQGVIFDLDGTLVNSLEDLADSMNTVLQSNKMPVHELQTYKQFVGKGIRSLLQEALPADCKDEVLINRCYDMMIEVYSEKCINKTKPYDGICRLLDNLVSRHIELAVFSNKADALTKKIVHALLPDWNFGAIAGLRQESHKKPNPLIALQISEILKIPPENFIYVGDSGIDMQTANNAGMYAVGALWGFRTGEELKSNGAKYLLKNPLDLIILMNNSNKNQ